MLIAFYVDFYYNVIIAWSLRFFFASFTDHLPWTLCNNEWNTVLCKPFEFGGPNRTAAASAAASINGSWVNATVTSTVAAVNETKFQSAASEYFK